MLHFSFLNWGEHAMLRNCRQVAIYSSVYLKEYFQCSCLSLSCYWGSLHIRHSKLLKNGFMWLLQVTFDGQVDIQEGLKKQSRKVDISFHIQITYYLKLLLRWFLVMKTVLFLSILNIKRTLFFQLINLIDYPLNQVFGAIILYLMLTPV